MNVFVNASCWAVSAGLWLSALSHLFVPEPADERAEALARAQLADVERPPHRMRERNPEWDLMQRMYRVLAFANRALSEGDEASARAIDVIVEDTLAIEREHGAHHFLLPYAKRGPFVDPSGQSVFVAGEIVMMLAVREVVSPTPDGRALLADRVERVAAQFRAGPILGAESYPDECWTFCNTVALAALRIADTTLGTDHADLARRWVESARRHLIDSQTGLIASSFTYDGQVLDGPEGSSLWMTAHNLRLIDPELAQDQYRRAHDQLSVHVLGFAYAREWPGSGGIGDIDSGPVIPLLGASPGSSGTALLGARSFDDEVFFEELVRSLELVTAGQQRDGELRYAAAGPMGDAVIFYAHEEGPLWHRIQRELRLGGTDDVSAR